MVQHEKCCFCIGMRKTCLVIAYYQILQQITLTSSCIRSLLDDVQFFRSCSDALYQETAFFYPIVKCIHIFMHIFYASLTILLLFGIHKNRLHYVGDYVIIAFIFIAGYTAIYVTAYMNIDESELDAMGAPLSIPLNLCFLVVIRNWWRRYTSKDIKTRTNA